MFSLEKIIIKLQLFAYISENVLLENFKTNCFMLVFGDICSLWNFENLHAVALAEKEFVTF